MKKNDQDNLGDLVFLDEYRISKKPAEQEHSVCSEYEDEHECDDDDEDYFERSHFNYLTASDIATLNPDEIKWIIRQLLKRSDFEWRKEEAHKMIDEILEE